MSSYYITLFLHLSLIKQCGTVVLFKNKVVMLAFKLFFVLAIEYIPLCIVAKSFISEFTCRLSNVRIVCKVIYIYN